MSLVVFIMDLDRTSGAHNLAVSGWVERCSSSTEIVLSILSDTTYRDEPCGSYALQPLLLLSFRFGRLGGLADAELTLAQDGVHPGDVVLDRLEAGGVFELTGRGLEAQVEQLFLGLLEEALDLSVGLSR